MPYALHDDSLKLKGIWKKNAEIDDYFLEYDDFGDPMFDSDDQFEILE